MVDLVTADVLEWCKSYDGPPFHAMLCDPPYHLHNGNPNAKGGFMGKSFDGGDIAFRPETWAALAEHLHPGAFIMAFASSRGWHRQAVAMEDAGLIAHPSVFMLGWAFGSGFPKATRIDTAIDRAAGAEREVIGVNPNSAGRTTNITGGNYGNSHADSARGECDLLTAPATPLAAAWEGHRYGRQAMKPALEPIIVFQKPYAGRPVDCITATGAGSLWIDGARVPTGDSTARHSFIPKTSRGAPGGQFGNPDAPDLRGDEAIPSGGNTAGRWPPNFALSHVPPTPCPCACYTPDGAPVAGCRECGGGGVRPGCERVGVRRVRGNNGIRGSDAGNTMYGGGAGLNRATTGQAVGYADADGLETVDDWRCVASCTVRRLGEMSGERKGQVGGNNDPNGSLGYHGGAAGLSRPGVPDSGTVARFFPNLDWSLDALEPPWHAAVAERIAGADGVCYAAKASRRERNAGCESFALPQGETLGVGIGHASGADVAKRNHHPTVKSIMLTRWLATLLLPPDAYAPRRILVPFAGSGSEAIGAMLAGWEHVTGIEAETEYADIARARVRWWSANRDKAPEVRGMGASGLTGGGTPGQASTWDEGRRPVVANWKDRKPARRNGHAPADPPAPPMLPGMEAAP